MFFHVPVASQSALIYDLIKQHKNINAYKNFKFFNLYFKINSSIISNKKSI